MEGELNNFFRLCVITIASILYSYFIAAKTPKGLLRLLSLFPVIILFSIIPFYFNSFHIGVPTLIFLAFLGNLKLLPFAFDQGPLSSSPDILHFILVAICPIKIKQNSLKIKKNGEIPSQVLSSVLEAANKATLLALLFYSYNYKQYFHKYVLLTLYFAHSYLSTQLMLTVGAIPAQVILGVELEPQFNAPLLSTSLQNFWGQRWNLRASDLLRASVYKPLRGFFIRIIGPQKASYPAVFMTFVTSGLIHELLYYQATREAPTWEVTWFFVLQGILVDMEIVLKKKLVATNKFRLHREVSVPLTLATMTVTSAWLCYPQLLRNGIDEKIIKEFNLSVDFLKGLFNKYK